MAHVLLSTAPLVEDDETNQEETDEEWEARAAERKAIGVEAIIPVIAALALVACFPGTRPSITASMSTFAATYTRTPLRAIFRL
jgi:hypothetical protein